MRTTCAIGGMGLLACAVVFGFAGTAHDEGWHSDIVDAVPPVGSEFMHLLRGGLAYLAIPVLLGTCAGAVAYTGRSGRRREALAVLALVVGANLSVQAIKHPPLALLGAPEADGRNLSGHVGVATATSLAVLLVVPFRTRKAATWIVSAFVAAFSAAVLLTGWHSLGEVLAPMFLCGAWSVSVFAALNAEHRDATAPDVRPRRRRRVGLPGGLAIGGTAVLFVVGALAWCSWLGRWGAAGAVVILTGAYLVIAGAAALTVGITAAFLPRWRKHPPPLGR